MEMTLKLAASPEDILKDGAEPFISEILRGISLEVKMNVWKKLADVMLKMIESGELDSALMPIIGGISPMFLLRVSGNLTLEVDEAMKTKITENPLVQPMVMDAQSLISATSSVSDEDEFEEHLNTVLPPSIGEIVKLAIENLGNEINFTFAHPQMGVKGKLAGNGLGLIVKNAVKYYK